MHRNGSCWVPVSSSSATLYLRFWAGAVFLQKRRHFLALFAVIATSNSLNQLVHTGQRADCKKKCEQAFSYKVNEPLAIARTSLQLVILITSSSYGVAEGFAAWTWATSLEKKQQFFLFISIYFNHVIICTYFTCSVPSLFLNAWWSPDI